MNVSVAANYRVPQRGLVITTGRPPLPEGRLDKPLRLGRSGLSDRKISASGGPCDSTNVMLFPFLFGSTV